MYDESAYAREVAAFHHTEHHEIMLSSREIIDTIPAVLASLDEPFGDSSAVPTYVVARETARDVTVALSGDGGPARSFVRVRANADNCAWNLR